MLKTIILLGLTIGLVFIGLNYTSDLFDIPRSEIFAWTGIIFLVYLLERFLKYIIQLPFKLYFDKIRKHVLAKAVQDTGLSLSYISFWIAIGFTPINAVVKGETPNFRFSNPIFLQIALVLFIATLIFSILWWLTLKIKR